MAHITLTDRIKNALNNKGQSMVEYVLILGLIALAAIASFTPIGKTLADKLTEFAAVIHDS